MLATTTINCVLSTPVMYDGTTPSNLSDRWQFKDLTCYNIPVSTSTITLDNKSFSGGEIVNSIFLFFIFMVVAYSFLWNRLIRKKINFMRPF